MKIQDKQQRFTEEIANLVLYAKSKGYGLTFGDAYRAPEVHGEYGTKKSYSAAFSVHKKRLAVDLNLFIDGEYIPNGDHPAWKDLGGYWKTLHPEARWGGDWNDANHFSFQFGENK